MALPLNLNSYPVLIASGTALSAGVAIGADSLVGIAMSSAWTAAGLSFQVSVDGGATWLELADPTGTAVAVAAAANQFIQVLSYEWRGLNMIKVRSGTAAAPVNQGADRNLILQGRPEIF